MKLEAPLQEILHSRIVLSREAKLFKLTELAKNWDICYMTLYRYDSPKYREIARQQARRATIANKVDRTQCQICHTPLKGHLRCTDCTMLVHGAPECSCQLIKEFLLERELEAY